MKLRNYQQDIFDQLIHSNNNDLVQLDTGAGKTLIEAAIAKHYNNVMIVAHRNILISQISDKLAAFKIKHNTISTDYTRRRCALTHRQYGDCYIDELCNNKLAVSIDSLISHYKHHRLSVETQKKWVIVIDEAHHVITDNKWGKLRELFTHSRIIGFTATPARMDGESLHVSNGGLFDNLIQSAYLKENSIAKLIAQNYLSDFKVYLPKANNYDFDVGGNIRRELKLVASPLYAYKKICKYKKTLIMCQRIEHAIIFEEHFKKYGISAAHISSQQSKNLSARILDAFKNDEIQVLLSVDMISEGFDLPEIEALILARQTSSFIAYRQWIGRALRPAANKTHAIIIDLAYDCNVFNHGMPDDHVEWNLENPPRGTGKIKYYCCEGCGILYKLRFRNCPECGRVNEATKRGEINSRIDIKYVDRTLLYHERQNIEKEEKVKRLKTELQHPCYSYSNDIFKKFSQWIVAVLQDNLTIYEVNLFLSDENTTEEKITSNFTLADFQKNESKVLSLYKKWRNSKAGKKKHEQYNAYL